MNQSPERWYQNLWKSLTSMFRVGEKETLSHVDMFDCMDGKPLSDKSLQDCLFNNQTSVNLPKKTLLIEGMKGEPVFLQLPFKKRIFHKHYLNKMSFICIPEDEESSPKVLKCSTDEESEEPKSIPS
ncbi:hypothetical protein TNCV_3132041 [Trichonephila clavipes]|uniref:Uncharacterized protein n=1 Tax=Trichonephila clavipes TaxID=2585209 RepID=A0A8X6RZ79_TRICX|nr:hypothetical protein TNCV_3132041 [Trichonephila clavipes]